jgi:hypothetical protein
MNELAVQTAIQYQTTDQNPLHQRIKEAALAEYDIDPNVISFGPITNVQTNANGHKFIEDLNGVVRYYLGHDLTVPTDNYEELCAFSTHDSYRGINPTSILQRRGKYNNA